MPDPERFGHIRRLLQMVRAELRGELPVIVFAGAPFTVATYCIGTGKDLTATRRFAAEQPIVWEELLDCLATATVHFLGTLVREGADCLSAVRFLGRDARRGRIPSLGPAAITSRFLARSAKCRASCSSRSAHIWT